eukprot:522343_1
MGKCYYSFSAVLAVVCIIMALYQYPRLMANDNEMIANVFASKECDYASYRKNNAPNKCGRILIDNFITQNDVIELVSILEIAYYHSHGGGTGGPTIFDLISGAVSSGNKFIDCYIAMEHEYKKNNQSDNYFTKKQLLFLRTLMDKIQTQIKHHFEIPAERELYITPPIFFSKISANRVPKKLNDEYFHYHNDTMAYDSFCYTGLVYLSDYGTNSDFMGGTFNFKHGETVTPKKGKLLLMSSGGENEHRVSNVSAGERIAFTMAWTLDKNKRAGKSPFLTEKERFFH